MGRLKAGLSLGPRSESQPKLFAQQTPKEVIVEKIVEKLVEVPVEVIKEVQVEVIREVQVPVQVIKEVQVPFHVEKIVTVVDNAKIDELSSKIKHLESQKPLVLTPKWVWPTIVVLSLSIIGIILLK